MTRQQNISSAILGAVGLLVSVLFAVGVAGCTSAEPETGGEPAGQAASQPLDEVLDPKHTVLLVHDMMNDFVAEGGASDTAGRRWNADGVMEPIANLLAAARAKDVRVAYARWTRQEDGSWDYVARGTGQTPPLAPVESTWGWEAPEAITPMPDDWIIVKTRPDAFLGTELGDAHAVERHEVGRDGRCRRRRGDPAERDDLRGAWVRHGGGERRHCVDVAAARDAGFHEPLRSRHDP